MCAVNVPAFLDLTPCLANGRAYAEHLPRAALKVLQGVGHSAILEAPEQCMALIAPFRSTGALP